MPSVLLLSKKNNPNATSNSCCFLIKLVALVVDDGVTGEQLMPYSENQHRN